MDRCVRTQNAEIIELHGFADASNAAYGACLYIRNIDNQNNIKCQLLCSKSRVAPLQIISTPKLELNAALLLSKLVTKVIAIMNITFKRIILWTDSSITLHWIRTQPFRLTTYVANRVSEIQELTTTMEWFHVDTKNNPADLVSRGVMPEDLQGSTLWWNGPNFLEGSESNWPQKFVQDNQIELPELKTKTFMSLTMSQVIPISDFSSFTKLIRVFAYCLRFINNKFYKNNCKLVGQLLPSELKCATNCLVKIVQYSEFKTEISCLKNKKELPRNSKLLNLSLFVDSDGLLRVGGRLRNSNLEFEQKHQMVLPKHHFTVLLFRHIHEQNLHSGIQTTLSTVRQTYWPINGKNTAKQVIHQCISCFRSKPRQLQQIMGQLPASRLEQCRPFNTSGVDFCGPFNIKYKNQRKDTIHKVYVCIFVCFSTRAVHLEVVEDFTTSAFIACLTRFLARRGNITTIWSDNGTNFVGAKNELAKLVKIFKSQTGEEIFKFCTNLTIEWKFIPPRSPHFGGLWESGVKVLKTHMKRVVGATVLTLEQMVTLVTQIEGIMNSRPLTPLSSDPNDFEPLTPGHFLTGGSINGIIESSITDVSTNRLKYWQRTTQMVQQFWKLFHIEYIHTLQTKSKWKTEHDNLKEGNVVLIQDENLPSNRWLLGRIEQTIEGRDKKVRVAVIRTKNGLTKRVITKLAKLPIN